MEKYKGLLMYDPDYKTRFTIWDENLEYHKGREGGWCLIGSHPSSDENMDEPYLINDDIVAMIAETEQAEGVMIVTREVDNSV